MGAGSSKAGVEQSRRTGKRKHKGEQPVSVRSFTVAFRSFTVASTTVLSSSYLPS